MVLSEAQAVAVVDKVSAAVADKLGAFAWKPLISKIVQALLPVLLEILADILKPTPPAPPTPTVPVA